jgi:hypothetical protein
MLCKMWDFHGGDYKNAVFCNVTYGSCKNRRFGGKYCLHHQCEDTQQARTTFAFWLSTVLKQPLDTWHLTLDTWHLTFDTWYCILSIERLSLLEMRIKDSDLPLLPLLKYCHVYHGCVVVVVWLITLRFGLDTGFIHYGDLQLHTLQL